MYNRFLTDYNTQKWNEGRKSFGYQTSVVSFKIVHWHNKNKEAKCGVLRMGSQLVQYTVGWRQNYVCFHGGQPQHKDNEETKMPCNGPGSGLSGCIATLNSRWL